MLHLLCSTLNDVYRDMGQIGKHNEYKILNNGKANIVRFYCSCFWGVTQALEIQFATHCNLACYRSMKTEFISVCNLLPLWSLATVPYSVSFLLPFPVSEHCPHGCSYMTSPQPSVVRGFLTPKLLATFCHTAYFLLQI
jgi:hypothetical protein